jgi:hypothetical protein
LKQKGNKKFKAMPASLKKLALGSENRPNSLFPIVNNFKQGRFLSLSHLFFGSSDNAAPNLTYLPLCINPPFGELLDAHSPKKRG